MKSNNYFVLHRLIWVLVFLGISSVGLLPANIIDNPDKPLNGDWDLKMQKEWTNENAGETTFAELAGVYVVDNGKVILQDGKHEAFFIFSPDGKFLKRFGKKGEGPGEIKLLGRVRCLVMGNNLIAIDQDRINYYDSDGNFLRSVRNQSFQRRPVVFIDENQFITAPLVDLGEDKKGTNIKLVNLKTDQETILAQFAAFKRSSATKGNVSVVMVVGGLTPTMVIGYGNDRLYCGMNDQYHLDILDLKGKKSGEFRVDRDAVSVSKEEKKKRFSSRNNVPQEMIDQIIGQLPDKLTFFENIFVVKNMVWVFRSLLERKNTQPIDIFSLEGTYLFRTVVKVEEGYRITMTPLLKENYIFLGLEDEDGNHSISKYKIDIPQK